MQIHYFQIRLAIFLKITQFFFNFKYIKEKGNIVKKLLKKKVIFLKKFLRPVVAQGHKVRLNRLVVDWIPT